MGSGRGWLAGDWPSMGGVLNITAAAWTAGFRSSDGVLLPGSMQQIKLAILQLLVHINKVYLSYGIVSYHLQTCLRTVIRTILSMNTMRSVH